jgi:hypothetical protein
MTAKQPRINLALVNPTAPALNAPPRKLGKHGLALWNAITSEFGFDDAAGRELLVQACAALDRAEQCAELIAEQGEIIHTKHGPKEHPLIKAELQSRAFIVRTLARLGIVDEGIKPVGRPTRFPGKG